MGKEGEKGKEKRSASSGSPSTNNLPFRTSKVAFPPATILGVSAEGHLKKTHVKEKKKRLMCCKKSARAHVQD